MSFRNRFRTWKRSVLKRVIKRPDIFMNPSDLSALDLLLDGEWDARLQRSISNAIKQSEESIVLIDIGANTGLISASFCNRVQCIVAVEPNPLASLILEANLLIASEKQNYQIIKKALCSEDGYQNLVTPQGNLGGAYIDSIDQRLTQEQLEKKEGGQLVARSSQTIETISAAKFFASLYEEIRGQKINKVIIKIDTEGLERVILEALLQSDFWKEIKVAVFFECWNSSDAVAITRLANTTLFSHRPKDPNWFICNQKTFDANLTEFFISNYEHVPSTK